MVPCRSGEPRTTSWRGPGGRSKRSAMTDLAGTPTAQDLADRTGYDPAFLGPGVPMPGVTAGAATVLLPYLHYSVLLRPDRKCAALTALDLDGGPPAAARPHRHLGLRPPGGPLAQAGPPVYQDNDLDRGHLVMRASLSGK